MAIDEPTRGLIDMGLGKRDAQSLSELLRGPVASIVSDELPDVEYSAALGVLITARPGLVYFLPKATQVLLGLGTGNVDPTVTLSSVYPVGYLDPVVYELLSRAKANPARDGRFRATLARRPVPGRYLQDFRRRFAEDIPAGRAGAPPVPSATAGLVGDQLRTAIAGIPDRSSHVRAREWTGWALLAAMHGFDTYDFKMPVPSKRRVDPLDAGSPQRAYRAGFTLLIGGALSLIDEAQG